MQQENFISKYARILCILQLCLAFSVLIFYVSKPFFQEIFHHKKELLLVNEILGIETIPNNEIAIQNKLADNKKRFEQLSEEEQSMIHHYYNQLVNQIDHTLQGKLIRLKNLLIFEVDPFEKAWILLAIVIPLFLLLKFEGAMEASWLLPVTICLFAANNLLCGINPALSADLTLFPSEEELIKKYVKHEPSLNIQQQYIQLKEGWTSYLIYEWANQIPSTDPIIFKSQAEEGQYAFNLARLKKIIDHPFIDKKGSERISFFLHFLYLIWNSFFAFSINRSLSTSKVYKNTVTQLQS